MGHISLHVEHQWQLFDAPVVFIDADVPVLLGRECFFDHYRITFDQTHNTFELGPK